MEMVVISKEDLLALLDQAVERAVSSLVTTKNTSESKLQKNWLTLPDFLKQFDISRSSWDRHYINKIKFRNDGIKVWVYAPSMEKYLMDKSIN